MLGRWLQARWYSATAPRALLPLSRLFGVLAARRRRRLQAAAERLPVPVIVVGNLAVGGTGKTPFAIWLVEHLRRQGWKPGVIARGYGGHAPSYPLHVTADTPVAHSGDEPLLIALRTAVPVVVAPGRVAAARALLASHTVDVLVADDGLQHYRLARDLEIVVIDGRRGLGNGALLPAGPLREAPERLDQLPLVVVNGGPCALRHPGRIDMQLQPSAVVALAGGEQQQALAAWRGRRVHAVAGIGNPQRFFELLREHGLDPIEHPYSDHHRYRAGSLDFADTLPVLMTEKDAVKYRGWATGRHFLLPVEARLDAAATALVEQSLDRLFSLETY